VVAVMLAAAACRAPSPKGIFTESSLAETAETAPGIVDDCSRLRN